MRNILNIQLLNSANHPHPFQVDRPIAMKKDGIQTRNRKTVSKSKRNRSGGKDEDSSSSLSISSASSTTLPLTATWQPMKDAPVSITYDKIFPTSYTTANPYSYFPIPQ